MTAVNVTISADRVCMFTDSAGLGLSGVVRRLASKVRTIPEMGCAIAVRGELRALDALAKILPTIARDFDGLYVAAQSGRLRRALGWKRAIARGHFALLLPFDLMVCGWSSAKGPAAFLFCNHARMRASDGGTGPEAWKPYDINGATIMPMVPLTAAMRKQPEFSMAKILEAQRAHREPSLFNRRGRQMVGGAIEKTTVTEVGVQVHTVGRWPDKVGKPIGGGTAHRIARVRMVSFVAAISLGTWIAWVACNVAFHLAVGITG